MKTYEEKTITRIFNRVTSITCDLCGRQSITDRNSWSDEETEVSETEIKYKTGEETNDEGYGNQITVDICPKCFTEKLIPWIKSQGGEPTITDWEW